MSYFYWATAVAFAILFAVTLEAIASRNDD